MPSPCRSVPTLQQGDGPVLYRRRFPAGDPRPSRRYFLVVDGFFYQDSSWLDGEHLGDTEGYLDPQSFEITQLLARCEEHLVSVEVSCQAPSDWTARRNLTGVFQHSPYIDPTWWRYLVTSASRRDRPAETSVPQVSLPGGPTMRAFEPTRRHPISRENARLYARPQPLLASIHRVATG